MNEQEQGASLRDRATRASTEPASGLGHSAGIPSANLIMFSHRDKVMRACMDPYPFAGERLRTESGLYEHLDHWRARAVIEAVLQLACESPSFAQAIEARRAETLQAAPSSDESAVRQDAPNPPPATPLREGLTL